ncbi:hypothetical protein AMTRI_Chr12g269910 [Amborella trichopoda]
MSTVVHVFHHGPRSLLAINCSLSGGLLRRSTLLPLKQKSFRTSNSSGFLILASASFEEDLNNRGKPLYNCSKNSFLSGLIQEIEPLDVSLIQKDASADTIDAMKRTISGMLGLLPSDQFHVLIEALWDPLSKLLVSSIVTGYTLRNAEYQLFLQKNLDISEGYLGKHKLEHSRLDCHDVLLDRNSRMFHLSSRKELSFTSEKPDDLSEEKINLFGLAEMTPEARDYITHLRSCLSLAKSELRDLRRKNAALQMQHVVEEEKNDLLHYLRSLEPEKVAELSVPSSAELEEIIHCVVHGLLATLSPKMHSKPPPLFGTGMASAVKFGEKNHEDTVDNTSLQFQPLISITRNYLARLLFWCMLMGHHLRGLEYRLELAQLLNVPETDAPSGRQTA